MFDFKGALNPNFFKFDYKWRNIFALDTFWSHFLTFFCKKVVKVLYLKHPFQSPLKNAESSISFKNHC